MSVGPWPGRFLLLGVAGSLLVFSTSLSEVYGLPKLAALALGTAAACATLALAAVGGAKVGRPTPLDVPLAAGALVMAAATAFGTDPFPGVVGVYSLYADGLGAYLLCALVFWAASRSDLPERPALVLGAVAGCSAVVGGYAAFQALGLDPFASLRGFAAGRTGSTLGDPVLLGAVLAGGLAPALTAARSPASGPRALGRAAVIFTVLGLAACGSRGAILAAAAGAVVWSFIEFADRPGARRAVLAASVVLALLGAGLWTVRRETGGSDSSRLALWACLPAVVREHPFLGSGPGTFQAAMRRHRTAEFVALLGPKTTQVHAHNDLLHAAATAGLLGLAGYLWLHVGAFALLRAAPSAAVAGTMAALFIQAKVNPLPLGAWALAALLLGNLARGERRSAAWWTPAVGAVLAAAVLLLALRLGVADARFAKARRAAAQGRAAAASVLFDTALSANPWEVFYRLEFARHLHKTGHFEGAAAQGAAAAALRPAVADGWAMLGTYLLVWRQAGGPDRVREASDALEKARRLDPFAPAVRDNKALADAMLQGKP